MTHPAPIITAPAVDPTTGDFASDETHAGTGTNGKPKPFSLNGDSGATPLATPPLSSPAPTAPTTTATATPQAANLGNATPGNNPTTDTAPIDAKAEGDDKSDHPGQGGKADGKPEENADTPTDPAATMPPDMASALNGLANLGPQLTGPLMAAATGLPAAALQGLGSLVPSLASAVLPQLAQLANQLGTGQPPATPSARLASDSADALAGPLGDLAGEGIAGDAARSHNQDLARQVDALREVERRLGEVLGLSSARTEADRAKIKNVITDVETALTSAGAQGNTPEAQTAVMTAMRKALDDAGGIVSAAAREKLTDAKFVRSLIQDYLTATAPTDTLHAGTVGSGMGADAVRAARSALGIPYVWGGGGALGPSKGGFDCSGLTSYAIAKGTHGRLILPRTTYDQIHSGRAVALNRLVPGDLVFSNFSAPGRPEHVAIYIGNGQVIEAPHRGAPVRVAQVPSGAQARRVL